MKRIGPEWPKALRKVHKEVADEAANQARREARGMGGVQRKEASAISGSGRETGAYIRVSGDRASNVAFWGAKRRSGWYAKRQYAGGPRQHPQWVGAAWDVGVASEGPYAINPALARYMPYLDAQFLEMIDELADEAFPGR